MKGTRLNPDLRVPGDPELGRLAPIETRIFFPLEIKTSSLADDIGREVFSTGAIARGSIIAIGGGQVTSDISRAPYDYTGVLDETYHIAPLDFDAPSPNWLINHSCESNTKVVGRLVIVARRDISAGEELTVDYGTIAAGDHIWHMTCHCGSARCRRTITHEDWKEAALFAAHIEEWPPFIQGRGLALRTSRT
jgi:uncharacterized protein